MDQFDNFRIELGNNIRKSREQQKISQRQLAEAADLSITGLSNIENGKSNISIDNFFSIMNVLRVSADSLLPGASDGLITLNALLSDCTVDETQLILDVASAAKRAYRAGKH